MERDSPAAVAMMTGISFAAFLAVIAPKAAGTMLLVTVLVGVSLTLES